MGTSQGNSITLQKPDPVILTKPSIHILIPLIWADKVGRKHLTLKANTKKELKNWRKQIVQEE